MSEIVDLPKLGNPLPHPDFSKLVEYIKHGAQHIVEHGREPKDFEHYAYELAVEAIYGEAHWSWLTEVSASEDAW